jgi:hypothetical protein
MSTSYIQPTTYIDLLHDLVLINRGQLLQIRVADCIGEDCADWSVLLGIDRAAIL